MTIKQWNQSIFDIFFCDRSILWIHLSAKKYKKTEKMYFFIRKDLTLCLKFLKIRLDMKHFTVELILSRSLARWAARKSDTENSKSQKPFIWPTSSWRATKVQRQEKRAPEQYVCYTSTGEICNFTRGLCYK